MFCRVVAAIFSIASCVSDEAQQADAEVSHNGRRHDADEVDGHLRPVDPGLCRVGQAQDVRAENRGDAQQE